MNLLSYHKIGQELKFLPDFLWFISERSAIS